MILDRKNMLYKRLSMKNLDRKFLKRIQDGMACSPFVAEAITDVVHEVYFEIFNSPESLKPGQMMFQCLDKNNGCDRKISEAKLVTAILTIDAGEVDQKIRKKDGVSKLRQQRLVRLCNEAYNQNGILTVEDLAYRLLNVGERTIVRDLAALRKEGEHPPLRSTVNDIGRTISHRVLIIKNWLKGEELSELKRKYNHSYSAIDNYINIFKRIVFLKHDGREIQDIAYLLKISNPLCESYLELWNDCSDIIVQHRREEILDLISTSKSSIKKKNRRS